MAKGKSFEHLVGLIREALKDHTSTKVLLNQKLESRTGRKRQFDVVVETAADGFVFRTAIECKEHGRRIEAKEIEAFHCKCDLVSGINKKVFVSNSSFQEGAISSAKELDIELHTLDKVTGEQLIRWINTDEIYNLSFSKRLEIEKFEMVFMGEHSDRPEAPISVNEPVYYSDGKESTLLQFFDWLSADEFDFAVSKIFKDFIETLNEDVGFPKLVQP